MLGRKKHVFNEDCVLLKGRTNDQFQPTSERHVDEEKHLDHIEQNQ